MNFFKIIIAILIFGAAFLLGALYMKPTQLSLVEQVKRMLMMFWHTRKPLSLEI